MADQISLQEFADRIVDARYRQPLKSLDEALDANGWERVDHPICCGQEIDIQSFIGVPYFAECMTCGKFIVDVSGPRFGNSWVTMPDPKKIDLEDFVKRWIAGTRDSSDAAEAEPVATAEARLREPRS